MLPGLLQLVTAVATTTLLVLGGLGQLVRYQVAQTDAANAPSAETRFAGLAFAERADWTPDAWSGRLSLEKLPPFVGGRTAVAAEPIAEGSGNAAPAAWRAPAVLPALSLAPEAASPAPAAPAPIARRGLPAPARATFAALRLSETTDLVAPAAQLAPPLPARESIADGIAMLDSGGGLAADEVEAPPAALITEEVTLPPSQVRLPVPRPAGKSVAKPKAKAKAAPAKKVARKTARKPARPAAAQPESLGALFGMPSGKEAPKN